MFTLTFWKRAAEYALVAFATTFTASLSQTGGVPSLGNLKAAGIAGGLAALYAFIKQLGGVQAVAHSLHVGVRDPKDPASPQGGET